MEDALCEYDLPRGGFIKVFPTKQYIYKYKNHFQNDEKFWNEIMKGKYDD